MPLASKNLLADETSPYLRQHKDNPVHWRAWSAEALAEAKALDKPILLSIGYAACHWCHVMAHESFEDADVADVMNRLFVNIKVDREERPDIDQIYMAALAATGEQGGWPLTMFLTPDAKPFWGGTYFPKVPRFGRPGFVQVLNSVHRAWSEKRGEINHSADILSGHVHARLSPTSAASEIDPAALTNLANGIDGMIDRKLGGLRGAPKFPNAPFMQCLWQNWLKTGDRNHRDGVLSSLRKMLDGGIYDHVGGGLSRYSTDADWLVPHFEKMLYDNAQLIRQANWAYAATGEKLFQMRIEETIAWLVREMQIGGGGFAASLDADSDGEEGLFYTWNREELEAALDGRAPSFLTSYTLASPAGWEGKPILHRNAVPYPDGHESEQLAADRERLRLARESRVRPGRDDKVLTDWNGLAIVALAEAGRHLGRPDWIDSARRAYRFAIESSDGDGRLPHSSLGERRLFPAMSSDYAAMINAAVALFEATGEAAFLDEARRLTAQLDRWYGDGEGGHFLTASDSSDLLMRVRGDIDEAVPSATGQIIEAAIRLASLTGEPALLERAWRIAELASARAALQAYGQAGIVNATALVLDQLKLVTVDDEAGGPFASIADRHPDPRRVDIKAVVNQSTAKLTLPGGTEPDVSKSGAWLCTGHVCLPRITDPAALEDTLTGRTKLAS